METEKGTRNCLHRAAQGMHAGHDANAKRGSPRSGAAPGPPHHSTPYLARPNPGHAARACQLSTLKSVVTPRKNTTIQTLKTKGAAVSRVHSTTGVCSALPLVGYGPYLGPVSSPNPGAWCACLLCGACPAGDNGQPGRMLQGMQPSLPYPANPLYPKAPASGQRPRRRRGGTLSNVHLDPCLTRSRPCQAGLLHRCEIIVPHHTLIHYPIRATAREGVWVRAAARGGAAVAPVD